MCQDGNSIDSPDGRSSSVVEITDIFPNPELTHILSISCQTMVDFTYRRSRVFRMESDAPRGVIQWLDPMAKASKFRCQIPNWYKLRVQAKNGPNSRNTLIDTEYIRNVNQGKQKSEKHFYNYFTKKYKIIILMLGLFNRLNVFLTTFINDTK